MSLHSSWKTRLDEHNTFFFNEFENIYKWHILKVAIKKRILNNLSTSNKTIYPNNYLILNTSKVCVCVCGMEHNSPSIQIIMKLNILLNRIYHGKSENIWLFIGQTRSLAFLIWWKFLTSDATNYWNQLLESSILEIQFKSIFCSRISEDLLLKKCQCVRLYKKYVKYEMLNKNFRW